MDAQRASEIQVLLRGVSLPASRDDLVRYAMGEDHEVAVLLQQRLPDQEFKRLNEVGDILTGTVGPPHPSGPLPAPESGKPPGGDDYLRPFPEPGAVREPDPPTAVLEQQAKTQKKQRAKQES
jgi:hypothetical protein